MARSSRRILKDTHTVLLIVLGFIIFTTAVEEETFRLPSFVSPISYNVILKPKYPTNPLNLIDVAEFNGKVEILAAVMNDTDRIHLHNGNNVTVEKTRITTADDVKNYQVNKLRMDREDYNSKTEIRQIVLKTTLSKDTIINITMEFTGKIETTLWGFYKSTYTVKDDKGKEDLKFLLTTQFEPTYARKAFPCFDEPKFKATFKISLEVPTGYAALSNTPMEAYSTDTLITFKDTVKMSTYLVAFIVYEKASFCRSIEVLGSDNVEFTTWGRKTAMDAHLGGYSPVVAQRILSALDDFTGIPYSKDNLMMKIDQVAVPDFPEGAMENWGLVTYKDTELLFDEVNGTEKLRKSVSKIIAHELSHQWFGNLVTLDWWSYTWLNEGFATFFQYFSLEKIYPQWRMMEQLVVEEQMKVLAKDALASAVPLNLEVNSTAQIHSKFGIGSYSKGACVVRLLSIVMGPENFQKGIQEYLKARKFDTATPEQLFEALEKHYPEDESVKLSALMTYASEPGYPVVTFTRNSGNKKVEITQERFSFDERTPPSEIVYPVNLEWKTNDGRHTNLWLTTKRISSSQALPKADDEGWFIVNNTGYFRVNYDLQNWINLYIQLMKKDLDRIAPLDRATLVDNAFNLALVNKLSYRYVLSLVRYLKREKDYIPWNAAILGLDVMHRMLINSDDSGVFNQFVRTLSQSVYNSLGFKTCGDHVETMHRTITLSWACRIGVENCNDVAERMLTAYLNEGKRVPTNLRSVVYCYGIRNGIEDLWFKMWKKLEDNEDDSERSSLISSLGCSRSDSTLYWYLQQSLEGDVIPQKDASSAFKAVYTHPEGVDLALNFLVENFDRIKKTYVTTSALKKAVTGIADYLTKDEHRVKMEKLVNDQPQSLESIGKTALETIDTNLKWLRKYKDEVLTISKAILSKEEAKKIL